MDSAVVGDIVMIVGNGGSSYADGAVDKLNVVNLL